MTEEEKRLIINTPITMECFESSKCTSQDLYNHTYDLLHGFAMDLEELREEYLKTKRDDLNFMWAYNPHCMNCCTICLLRRE